jgi:hypothetical protein
MRRQHRARRQGRATRPRRDIQRMASPSGVSSRNRPAGESESGTTLVDALSGASADAGSIPAASTFFGLFKPFLLFFREERVSHRAKPRSSRSSVDGVAEDGLIDFAGRHSL